MTLSANLLRITDRNSRVTRHTYDNLDRLTEENWIDNATPTPTVGVITNPQGSIASEIRRVSFANGVMNLTGGAFTPTAGGPQMGPSTFSAEKSSSNRPSC